MEKLQTFAAPLGRFLLGSVFIVAGLSKVTDYTGTQSYMEAMGVPGMLLPLVLLTEIGGGLAIVLGWQTRIAALALAGFCVLSGLLFHLDPGDQMQLTLLTKNFSMAGGFLLLVTFGAGALSFDNRSKSHI